MLVTDEGTEEEAVTRLARIGYDNVRGFLKGGMDAWRNEDMTVDTIQTIEAADFVKHPDSMRVLDVRRFGEFDAGHVENAKNIPLDFIYSKMDEMPEEPFYIHCKGGYRSIAAASVLKSKGFENIVNINGGFDKMVEAGLNVIVPA